MLLKRIEMIHIHSSYISSLEFLECLLCQFLHSNSIKLSLDCPCDAIQNGLNELEFANLLTNQQLSKYCNEKDIHETSENPEMFQSLLNDYEEIRINLERELSGADKTALYMNLNKLIIKIADYICRNEKNSPERNR